MVVPPILPALRRATAASLTPPLLGVQDSVWSSTWNTGLLPSALVAFDVRNSIRPDGKLMRVSIGSMPGYSSNTGPCRIISSIGTQAFAVCDSDTASKCTSGVRTRDHGLPTGRPSASHPSNTTGARPSAMAIADRNGDLPQPLGREITPRRTTLRPVTGSKR